MFYAKSLRMLTWLSIKRGSPSPTQQVAASKRFLQYSTDLVCPSARALACGTEWRRGCLLVAVVKKTQSATLEVQATARVCFMKVKEHFFV